MRLFCRDDKQFGESLIGDSPNCFVEKNNDIGYLLFFC